MSLELFESKKGRAGKLLLDIDDAQYQELKKAFKIFQSKSGIKIDEFTDTEITSSIEILIESVCEFLASSTTEVQIGKDLLCALSVAKFKNKSVLFLGGHLY